MGKRELIWSAQSKIELFEIMNFYRKRNGNATYSLEFYTRIEKSLELCRTFAFIGKKTKIENVRAIIVDDFLIFYEVTDTEIIVLTIWNSKRNPENLHIRY
jgi:plasmid stabilization system protein ParE